MIFFIRIGSLKIHSFFGDNMFLTEEIFFLVVFEIVARPFNIQEHSVGTTNIR